MPKRINKMIELLEQGQPIYYTGAHSGAVLNYKEGLKMSKTWADYINVGMEHGAFDMAGLDQFMCGLIDGGPTNSGHRTPAVIVEVPVDGGNAEIVRANSWQFRQVLSRGVHGILLCHAENPGAVRAFVETCRYPINKIGMGNNIGEGHRGAGGQNQSGEVWGISGDDYLDKADPWPLNPDGELLLGLKIENKRALANVELTTQIPGIAFAEWGPGDMSLVHGYKHLPPLAERPPELVAARNRIKAACDKAGLFFLNSVAPDDVVDMIDEGVMVCAGNSEEAAKIGRAHTKREMPV